MPEATILIVTHNRRDELRRALASACEQEGDNEILVLDDASTDGTAEMVAREFPAARVVRTEESHGCIGQRNRGADLARAPIIVSLDDDAVFTSPRTVGQTLEDFDDPAIGAVAIPLLDAKLGPGVHQCSPRRDGVFAAATFIGAAYAIRRDVFRAMGGYRVSLEGYWEETELTIRMLDAGSVVRLGRADPVRHQDSSARKPALNAYRFWRNAVVVGALTVPGRSLPGHLAWLTANAAVAALRGPHRRAVLRGLATGYRRGWAERAHRRPVRRATFRLRQIMWRKRPVGLDEVNATLRTT